MSQQKELRINLRATAEQRDLIERAALVKRSSMSAFILDNACEAAEQILADQRDFQLAARQWKAFCKALDAEPEEISALKKLFEKPSVFRPRGRKRSRKT